MHLKSVLSNNIQLPDLVQKPQPYGRINPGLPPQQRRRMVPPQIMGPRLFKYLYQLARAVGDDMVFEIDARGVQRPIGNVNDLRARGAVRGRGAQAARGRGGAERGRGGADRGRGGLERGRGRAERGRGRGAADRGRGAAERGRGAR